jgi:plastocyanin
VISSSRVVILSCVGALAAALVIGTNDGAEARAAAPRRAARTVEIKMVNMVDGARMNRYQPQDITIQVGDTVKWVASGGSHNVAFWKDSIPAGAEALITKAMEADKDTIPLATKRYPTAGTGFTMVFAGFPKGVYKYFCSPHLRMGMVGKITVE